MHAALRDRGWVMKHMKINRLMRDLRIGTVMKVLGALGLRLTVAPKAA